MCSKDTDEELLVHSKSDNMKNVISDKVDDVIETLFESFLARYQISLETMSTLAICAGIHSKCQGKFVLAKFAEQKILFFKKDLLLLMFSLPFRLQNLQS